MNQNLFRLIGVLSLTAVAFCQPKDVEGWSKIKWGMTVAESREAIGKQVSDPTDAPGPNFVLINKFIVNDVKIGDIVAKAAVQTARNSDVVSAVTIEAAGLDETPGKRADTFSTLKRLLIEKYGTPKNEDRKQDGRGDTDSTLLWIFPSTSITLLWSESSGRYGIGYVTIRYKAVDKKSSDLL